MKMNWILWLWNKKIECKSNEALNDSKILKFGSIHDNLFLLTTDFNLLFGKVDLKLNCVTLTRQPKLKLKDLDCYGEHLYTVDFDGTVHKRRSDLEVINEIPIYDELKGSCQNCIEKVAIKKIFTNKFGVLFISDSNQLWGSGFMPQVGITSETPKLVNFFRNKRIYDACVGSDFAAVIVSKHNEFVDNYESSALTSSCSHCSISSPVSENNSLSSSCPLGLKVFDNSLEKLSISSIEEINKSNEEAAEKNIIFRNTEAAKQFLTSKISWMSSAGEEYLIEYTEKPTRIIKENMTNVASLVYEGVKSVKSTLSRHVSGSSDCNEPVTSNSNGNIAQTNNLTKINSTENLLEYYDAKSKHLLQTGADLLNTEVWTWGVIVKGLIGDNQLQKERPIKVTKLINIGAKKISAAGSHLGVWTLDGRAFVWGCNVHNQVTYESRVDFVTPKYLQQEVRSRDVACGNSHTVVLTNFFDVIYLGAQAEKPEIIYNFVPKCGTNEEEFGNRHILCFENYTILNERRYFDKILVEFLNEEQKALEEFLAINSGLIKPSLKKIDMSDHYGLYEDFTESFTNVVNMFSANINSIFEGIVDEKIFIKYANECVLILQTYLLLYNNILSIDGIKYISKIIDIPDFITNLRSNVPNKEELISTLLLIPYQRVDSYITFINNQPTTHEAKYKWETFKEEQETKSHEALKTKDFWISAGKLLENLKQPERRLVRDSNNHPIYLLNSGRFSSHWFILLNDIFIHVNGSTLNIHELATLWIDLKEDICQICFKTPEENFTLFTNTPEEKIEWFHVLQNTIKGALKKTDALQPPLIRNASYTFMKNAFYKGAKYTGRWNNGIMHGPGEIVWKNGQSYNGEFCSNQLCGFGRMLIPNVGIYEGEWKENLQNGFGVLDYFNNEVYKGYFKDGFPHGHGILRKGNFNTATASVYIGEWQLGAKSGYGIMDDITSGEKYLGNWQDNKKQGNGLIVTSDSAYYEGTFQQDNFLGNGLMILEDGTYYEGDFRGIGQLSGKGRLTLKSGHVIEGNLHGNWSGTVKISSSTLRKLPIDGVPSVPDNFEKLCTHVDDKWKALFQYCYQILGVNENTKNDIKKVWDNVAVCLSNSHQIYVRRFKGDKNVENSLKNLDIIPPYGRENLDLANYTELKQYLSNAFQSQLHPLGILLNDLCVAYTATYGGMVAHPLLLTHAVSELHSIIKRLYEIIRILFPALPMHEKEKLIKTTRGDEIVGFRSLLYPIILPRIYSSLFTLYALKNKQQELMYSKRLMEWNKHSDSTLLNFFSGNFVIHQIKFDNTEIFSEAIETLQQIKTTFSPTEKLLVIKETMQKMTPFAKEHLGTNYVWNMDDLFPIFLFVVIRARILDLGSEIDFMENFMEPSWEQGELGLMFTTLKACYHQILLENSSVT